MAEARAKREAQKRGDRLRVFRKELERRLSSILANRSGNTAAADFQYTVTLSYGSRYEPWIVTE